MPSRSVRVGKGEGDPEWWRAGALVRLTRVHALHSVGDALITVSLASTLFFNVEPGTARGRVALYLVSTMAPFSLLAPVIGPLLDRARQGRRAMLAITFVGRAVLALLMAGAAAGLGLYPLAFGVLVLSRSYGVARSAALPRMLPKSMTLVGGNARLTATGLVCGTLAGVLGVIVNSLFDFRWTLRLAMLALVAGALLVIQLPREINEPAAEEPENPGVSTRLLHRATLPEHTTSVRVALQCEIGLRALVGFLTTFLAFVIRGSSSSSWKIGLVIGGAALGSAIGTGLGVVLRAAEPDLIAIWSLTGAVLTCALGARFFVLSTAIAIALAAALTSSLAKLALDATLQRDVPEEVRAQAFARTETTLQLAWVAGGGLGLALPLRPGLGMSLAAIGLVVVVVLALQVRRRAQVA